MSAVGLLKRAVKRSMATQLGWRSLGALVRKPGVIVLTYHRILGDDRSWSGLPVEDFAMQMRWLRAHCDPIAPDALVERAQRPRRLGRPSVLVTFDDGYRDYHDLAYPVLESLGIPAVVFLVTSLVDDGGLIWTEEVQSSAQLTRKDRVTLPWSRETIALPDAAARKSLGEKARAHLKTIPDGERRDAIAALLAELGNPPPVARQMLTWDEVRRASRLTTWGGHSHTHPIMSRLDADAADREIRLCKERIAAETGRAPTTWAYPNGRRTDYTPETQAILRRHGFTLAFATSEGIAGADSDWMAIKRLPAEIAHDPGALAWLAAGMGADPSL